MGKEIDTFLEHVNQGLVSPMPKDQRGGPNLLLLPGETIRWLGKVDTQINMFGSAGGRSGAYGVLLGVTAYRIILYLEKVAIPRNAYLCRSFWFEVDMQGEVWQRGRIRKTQHTSLSLCTPKYKKGVVSREIEIANESATSNGKRKRTFSSTLNALKFLDPQTGKYKGGRGRDLHDSLMDAYRAQQAISLKALMLFLLAPDELEDELFPVQAARGKAIKSTRQAKATPYPAIAEPASDRGEPALVCPHCGNKLGKAVKFCAACGNRVVPLKEEPRIDEAGAIEEAGQSDQNEETEEPLICPACAEPVKAEWKVCPLCGAKLPPRCINCRREVDQSWTACAYCGNLL